MHVQHTHTQYVHAYTLFIFCILTLYYWIKYRIYIYIYIYMYMSDADKSLARPTSRCRRTESIVSLEIRVWSCAELRVFSCYRGWKEACQATRAISTTSRRELSSSFFFLQGKAPNEIHAILIETLGEHATSYSTVKIWACVAQFKRGDFSIRIAPRSGRPKRLTTPEIIDQIHEIILENRRISAKTIAEQPGISRERVGSILHEYLDTRKLSAKWVSKCLNGDQKRQRCQSSEQILQFFGAIQIISCRARLVTMDEIWLYHYDPETKKQSIEWRHSGPPRSKKFRVQISAGKVLARLDFLGSGRHTPHWFPSKGPNYQRGVLLISAGATEGHFEGKTPRRGHQEGLVLEQQRPGSPCPCNPEETGLPGLRMSWSPILFFGSGPVGLPSVLWTEKTIERSQFFVLSLGHCCRGDLLGRTNFWFFF